MPTVSTFQTDGETNGSCQANRVRSPGSSYARCHLSNRPQLRPSPGGPQVPGKIRYNQLEQLIIISSKIKRRERGEFGKRKRLKGENGEEEAAPELKIGSTMASSSSSSFSSPSFLRVHRLGPQLRRRSP